MSRKATLLLASLLPLTLASACSTSLDGTPVDEGGDVDPYDPEPGEPGESARVDGTYEVRSLINFSESTAGIAGVLNSLDGLSDDPAGTLIGILEASGNDFLDDLIYGFVVGLNHNVGGFPVQGFALLEQMLYFFALGSARG